MITASARLAASYCIYFTAVGLFTPFWSPYLAWRGFSALEISWILAAASGVRAIGPFMIGWLADLHHPTRILRLAAVLAAASFVVLPADARLGGFIAFSVLFSLTWNSIGPLYDVHTLAHSGSGSARYGRVRLWGSLGFIAASWVAGALFEHFGYEKLPAMMAALVVATLLMTCTINPMARAVRSAAGKGFAVSLRSRAAQVSLLTALLIAMSFGAYYTYFSLYLEGYGYNRQAIGLLWALGVVAEIVVFASARSWLSRFSIRALFVLAGAGSAVRWIAIALLARFPLVLAVSQLLHCLGFAVLHYAIVLSAQRLFPSGMESRGQTIFSCAGYGLGGMLGNLLAGVMWVEFSPRTSYVCAAFIVVLATVLAAVGLRGTLLDRNPTPTSMPASSLASVVASRRCGAM